MIVDLAIENSPNRPVFVRHRLGSGRRQVDNAKACMDKRSLRP